jgi:hypothetical protein
MANADHRGIRRLDVSTDDGLDRHDELRRDDRRVGGKMRGCAAMAASAEEGRCPSVARGQERALAGCESPDRPARSVVHAVDRVQREALE